MPIAPQAVLRRAALPLCLALILSAGMSLDAEAKNRHHRRDRTCERPRAHREVIVHRSSCRPAPVVTRPVVPRHVRAADRSYYWNVSLGFYVPRLWVGLQLGDVCGDVSFYDPYCDRTFRTVRSFRMHAGRCGHPAAVDVRFGPGRHHEHDHDDYADGHWR